MPDPSPAALCIIPARMGSTRFPGKPLAADTGQPLIRHVVENAARARHIDRIVVATDDRAIFHAVETFGAQAVMTGDHPNGTSRIAEAVTQLSAGHELILNVQGDEPEIDPDVIDALVLGLAQDNTADMATLYAPFAPDDDPTDPNLVKVVKDRHNRALYFSRSPIPFHRDQTLPPTQVPGEPGVPGVPGVPGAVYKHPGLYAYRRSFLLNYPTLAPTPLEQAEQLEQLRVLEHGYKIALIHAQAPHPGIDTPEQYAAFVARHPRK